MARDFYSSEEIWSSNNTPASNNHHNDHQRDHQDHEMVNQIQGFHDTTNHHHQIFGLNTNTGLIDFSKQQNHHHHHHHQNGMASGVEEASGGENLLLEDSSPPSMRISNGNFPCEVNEERAPPPIATRPSQGLSLSLSSSNPTSISLPSFELRPQTQQHDHVLTTRVVGSSRQGYFGKLHQNLQHTQMMMMTMMMNNNSDINTANHHRHHHHQQQQHGHNQFQIVRSKYLVPAQELLNEFCSLGTKQSDEETVMMKQKIEKGKQQWESNNNNDNGSDHHHHHHESASTSSRKHVPPLHSLEFMELQKRKAKLLSMLDEIDRRYHHYREQMRAAAAAFEAAAGVVAAETYTALAAKAMSRHFRCLRDSVVGQIQATKKAMGEREDPGAPGTTRGETPRLRLLDQALRQQKVYRQMSLVDPHPWRPQRGLPERAVSILRAWLFEHFLHPYPSDVDKHILARQTGLSRSQVSNWFINARVRLWKPMIEEMYSEETRGERNESINHQENIMVNPVLTDPKPELNPIMNRADPGSLSSIITNPSSKTHHQGTTPFGSSFDFSLYGHQAVTYGGDSSDMGFEDRTRGVSLTLGLQRHNDGNGGVSLAFSPAAQGAPLFFRDHVEDYHQQGSVQYSTTHLDGDDAQNLPYRNLMGAQLLHDIV
ncbi:PREDICTED: homeobox protein BEL1 homolog [Tarenaya hassleriana]|uniref:homeobox protein BEL1 homolog n=1 Tax=Tarenaya hassleriana TaxID=28532 RepID=UPI00053C2AAE|nr:PREDICTED: homeobox protein BEL1 homolog [Tarenaya hassleriana]